MVDSGFFLAPRYTWYLVKRFWKAPNVYFSEPNRWWWWSRLAIVFVLGFLGCYQGWLLGVSVPWLFFFPALLLYNYMGHLWEEYTKEGKSAALKYTRALFISWTLLGYAAGLISTLI